MSPEERGGGSYRVEVSGWDLTENFFVEKTLLSWQEDGSKRVLLRTPLNAGTLVFVRLIGESPGGRGVPVTYQVERIAKTLSGQGCEVLLERLHPKFSEPGANDSLEVRGIVKM
jgi:hypothetical protein